MASPPKFDGKVYFAARNTIIKNTAVEELIILPVRQVISMYFKKDTKVGEIILRFNSASNLPVYVLEDEVFFDADTLITKIFIENPTSSNVDYRIYCAGF